MSRLRHYSAVFLMASFFWAMFYHPAYSATTPAAAYNAAMSRVARIAPKLEALAGRKTPIMVTPDMEKEAFVLPDGNIIITTGLVALCKTDDEFAFIIAHELSHVVAKDFENSGTPGLTGSRGIPDLQLREIKADENAVRYLKNAGYNPYASISILARLSKNHDLKDRLDSLSRYLKNPPSN